MQNKRLSTMLACTAMLALQALPTWAIDDIRLPYELMGTANHHSLAQTTLTIDGTEHKALELADIVESGKVYYLPDVRKLLFEEATIGYDKTTPVFNCYSTAPVDLVLRGSNSFSGQGPIISTKGAVVLSGEVEAGASLTLNTPLTAIQCVSRLTVAHLLLDSQGATSALLCTGGSYADSQLLLEDAQVQLNATKECVAGFKNIITVKCGLPAQLYAGVGLAYDKRKFALKRNDGICQELIITNTEAYLPINTQNEATAWLADSATPETPDGVMPAEEPVAEETTAEEPTVEAETPVAEEATSENEEAEGRVFDVVESMPEYDEGSTALQQYISENLTYPVVAQEMGIQGNVYVSFIVEKDGTVSDAKILRSPDPALTKEALRLVNSLSGHWRPGLQGGQPVRTRYMLPVRFKLTAKE